MSTNASPKILKITLLFFNSVIFIIGVLILIVGITDVINLVSNEYRLKSMSELEKVEVLNETISSNTTTTYIFEDRFPSTASPSVIIIFALITLSVSVLGITAVNKQKLRLLSAYSLALVIAFSTRFIFFLATVCMHAYNIDYNPIRVTTLLSAGISTVEIILVMCVCHFTKIIKRGSLNNIETLQRNKSTS
jgi:hypothetical protein